MVENPRYIFDQAIKEEFNVTHLAGSDEVGRGAMAGPIVVASVVLQPGYNNIKIMDSKLISEKNREILFSEIIANSVCYDIKVYEAPIVDQLNPKATSVLGMKESILALSIKPELCLIDGENVVLPNYQTKQIIKGDNFSQTIGAASILAKVYRDRIMREYAKEYQDYGFEEHKGYCTKKHIQQVEKLGILKIHRLSYKPIAKLKEN